jgi:hypothetical protein
MEPLQTQAEAATAIKTLGERNEAIYGYLSQLDRLVGSNSH